MIQLQRRRGSRRIPFWTFALLVLPLPLTAQQIVVSGVVVDSAARAPVAGATVTFGSDSRGLTDGNGVFRAIAPRPGVFELRVEAVGYAPYARTLIIERDTNLVIVLPLRPVQIDTLQVQTRRVKVDGWIRERATGRSVINANIMAIGGRHEVTKRPGYFKFNDVHAHIPFDVSILAFGFEPVYLTVLPSADTTLHVELEVDTMIKRLLTAQEQRLEKRARDAVGRAYSIDRARLLKTPAGMSLREAVSEVLQTAPFSYGRGTTCYVVDEEAVPNDYVDAFAPEEVHRVEVHTRGGMNMIRVYTRRFMSDLIVSNRKLPRPGFRQTPLGFKGTDTPVSTICY